MNLASLKTGLPSGELINAGDGAQVAKTALAVEFRTPPTQCNFAPMLANSPPALCEAGTATSIFSDSFERGKRGGVKWLLTHTGSTADYTARNWGVVTGLPSNRFRPACVGLSMPSSAAVARRVKTCSRR